MFKKIFGLFLPAAILLSACGTLEVHIAALPSPSQIVVPASALPSPEPPLPTQTATIALVPSPSPASNSCNRAFLVSDVTVPDGAIFAPNNFFTKTWRIKNVGACIWTTSYKLIFFSGHTMGSPGAIILPSPVAPGESVDLSVTFTAPDTVGTYRGYWALSNASGAVFGIGPNASEPFWVEIVVSSGIKTYHDSELGLVFDYPSTWYIQPISFGVYLTSYDPANPPHKLEWTPSTIAMTIQAPPMDLPSDSLVDAFVENVKLEAAATQLDIVAEERLTLAGFGAARITVVSGSGGIFDYVGILISGELITVNIQGGNFDLARTVLDTLRRP